MRVYRNCIGFGSGVLTESFDRKFRFLLLISHLRGPVWLAGLVAWLGWLAGWVVGAGAGTGGCGAGAGAWGAAGLRGGGAVGLWGCGAV